MSSMQADPLTSFQLSFRPTLVNCTILEGNESSVQELCSPSPQLAFNSKIVQSQLTACLHLGNYTYHETQPEPLNIEIVQKLSLNSCPMHEPVSSLVSPGTTQSLCTCMETFS